LTGAISTQAGSALAVHAFRRVGPVGLAWGRIVFAAAVLLVATGVLRSVRPARSALAAVGVFGVALAAMDTCFYLSIDRTPLGLAVAGGQLADARALGYCAAVGVLGSAIPYGLEQAAMRRVPARTFSVLLALHPAVAAAVGAIALGQGLGVRDVVAIMAVVL